MKPRRALLALPTLLSLACGDSSSESSFSGGGTPGTSGVATTDQAATTTNAALPTTSDGTTVTDTAPLSTSDTGIDATATVDTTTLTTADDTTTTLTTSDDTTTTSDDTTTTSDNTTTAVGDDTTTTSDDTNDCPAGTQGCPCGPGNSCDPGLMCQAGACVDVAECGDGVVEGDEACDLGGMNSNTGACKLDCSTQSCGDGFVGPGEACDLGAMNSNTGACKLNCSKQTCGDGFLGPGEACDDGNLTNGDGCESNCTKTPVGQDKCGQPGDGVWIEIDYSNAFSATNPAWKYGGWTESQWAPTGQNYPYINAIGGVTINNDSGNIGTVAGLYGTNKYIRVFIGLGGLVSYTHATACVEGRSYSTSSSVTFRVENALNDCGANAMMSNDWISLHPTNVDLGANCFLPGNDFQAVEVRPVGGSGSLSFKRMRVTFHGAVF